MTAYTRADGELKIWVPRRSKTKSTYPSCLDNTVAGGLTTGELPFECIVREAEEEASLPDAYVRENVKSVGVVTYFHVRDARAGGEVDLLMPEVEYTYEIELPTDIVPKPGDDEVEEFYLWNIAEVKEALARGEFKPNCAVVLIDFMIRHNLLTPENEKDYLEIVCRLHRKFEFPTGLYVPEGKI
jgi:8-oxo-dGTP pyrophosphatase MutT (NUDIX family)